MAQNGFNIKTFAAEINKRGIQRPNKFLVRIFPPAFMLANATAVQTPLFNFNEVVRAHEYWCEMAAIPGVQLATRQVLRYGYGAIEKKPYAPVFNDITLTFIGDGKGINWSFFHTWINTITLFDARNGIAPANQKIVPFEVMYKTDYAVDINIITYNDAGQPTLTLHLREAYPFTMQDLPLNWADNNNIMRVPITFTFHDYYLEAPANTPAPGPSAIAQPNTEVVIDQIQITANP